jgi:condensin-2 complex subunit H2
MHSIHACKLWSSVCPEHQELLPFVQVSCWRSAISHIMLEQDERPPFDVLQTSAELVQQAATMSKGASSDVPFAEVMHCTHKYEVARCFSALLQQVNNERVSIKLADEERAPLLVRVLNGNTTNARQDSVAS